MSLDWRSLPSLSALRALDATARHGGFSGAGRALNVTHAAVAQQVRQLEKDLGQPLVIRQGRSISLTDAGARLALALNDGFSTIAAGVDDLTAANARRGLRINTTVFIADALIMPRLAGFWAKHPGLEVALVPTAEAPDILREGYDLAIRCSIQPGMDSVLLARARIVLVGAPSLLAETPPDLAKLPWLSPQSGVDQVEFQVLERLGLDWEKLTHVRVGSPLLELSAARRGLGLIFTNALIVGEDLASGRLQEVPVEGLPDLCYYAILPKGPHRAAVDQFVIWLGTIF